MMDKTKINETLRRNVTELSKQTEREVSMMPATVAPLPSVDMVKRIVALVKNIIFPDYFEKRQPDEAIRAYHIGVAMEELVKLLTKQIAHGLQFCEHCEGERTKDQVYDEAEKKALAFIDALPEIKRLLYTDIQAMFDNDPAAPNYGEVIFCYPSMNTMELAHSKTGIDIHPGAQIGEYFAIDHGTGVVIGETTIIGNHVTLYQGVTLGAKSFKYDENGNMLNIPRHPILEDHVTVYSNASILGRITIGHDSVIGGNIWITHSVPPHSRIQQSKAVDVAFQDGAGI